MTKPSLIPPEKLSAEERASTVSSLVRQSVDTWLQIALHVHDARESLSPDEYDEFIKLSGLTTSICDKLLRIAKTPALYSADVQKHRSRLEGWTTLYEVSKLKPAKFDELIQTLEKSPDIPVTREFINQFRDKSSNASPPKTAIAQILIDQADVLRFDFDQLQKLRESLDEIQRIIDRSAPAVSMTIKDCELEKIENALTINDESDHKIEADPVKLSSLASASFETASINQSV